MVSLTNNLQVRINKKFEFNSIQNSPEYPDNTNNNFKVTPNFPINTSLKDGTRFVSLHSASLPYKLNFCEILKKCVMKVEVTYNFSGVQQSLLASTISLLKSNKHLHTGYQLSINSASFTCKPFANKKGGDLDDILNAMNQHFALIPGLEITRADGEDKVFFRSRNKITIKISLDNDKVRRALGFVLTGGKIIMDGGQVVYARNGFDMRKLMPGLIFIHANFVNESHYNNGRLRLLAILDLDAHYRELPYLGFTPNNPRRDIFMGDTTLTNIINTDSLKHMHFVITDHNGEPFPFYSEDEFSSLYLTFSNKWYK